MAPRLKITREDIIEAALDIVRNEGSQAVNARSVAAKLGCSTQPVFTNFDSMEDLDLAVVRRGLEFFQKYMEREIALGQYPEYKARGLAYIRLAKEEKRLFKFLYMREVSGDHTKEEKASFVDMEGLVHNNTGLGEEEATLFHLEMWACVHGIATMFASGYLELEWDLVSRIMTDIYLGLRKQYGKE